VSVADGSFVLQRVVRGALRCSVSGADIFCVLQVLYVLLVAISVYCSCSKLHCRKLQCVAVSRG